MVVLLDLVAFDTVCHSVLLLCLHDRVDVTLSALVLLCQHRNSDLHPQSAIKCRMVYCWLLFFFCICLYVELSSVICKYNM